MAAGDIHLNSTSNRIEFRDSVNTLRFVTQSSSTGGLGLPTGGLAVNGFYLHYNANGVERRVLGNSDGTTTPGRLQVIGTNLYYGALNGTRMRLTGGT